MKLLSETSFYVILLTVLAFMWLVFDRDIAQIYTIFLVIDYIMFDKYGTSLIHQVNNIPNNTPTAILWAGVGIASFLGLSFIMTFFLQSAAPIAQGNFIQGYLKIFAQITPILSGNKILTFIGWAIVVPFIETRLFFGRFFDFLCSVFNVPQQLFVKNYALWSVFIVIASVFTYFHVQVRGLANNVGLAGTFIFAIVSMWLVVKFKELEPAIYFHNGWNGMVVVKQLWMG